jgi:hypothetical protein
VNYSSLSVKSSDFQDPKENASYVIGITTRKNGKHEISATMEQGAGSRVVKVIGDYYQRTVATTTVGIQTGSTLKVVTITSNTDINKFFPADTVLSNGTSPTARTIIKISSDGKTITLSGDVPGNATTLSLSA